MATLDSLKRALRQEVSATEVPAKQPLTDVQYSVGFETLAHGSGWQVYQDFIIPQLYQVLAPLVDSCNTISVLEVGPGPKSVLESLPEDAKRRIKRYTAFEPNSEFATSLNSSLSTANENTSALPGLDVLPDVHQRPFVLEENALTDQGIDICDHEGKYDLILFCHSMYGMKPKRRFIERALGMLKDGTGAMVVVFHRDIALDLDGLVCHRMANFPEGVVCIKDDDEVLDSFAHFIAGFTMQGSNLDSLVLGRWRMVCRKLGIRTEAPSGHLSFSAPGVMLAFTQHATALPKLTAHVPLAKGNTMVKNREARLRHPSATVRPTKIEHIQQCVRWASKHKVGLTIIGGGHSGQCIRTNVVAVDMSAFDMVHIHTMEQDDDEYDVKSGSLVVAESGCNTGNIIRKTMAAGLTVPLGARPSVGAGLWLQGGIGHLARSHGLACDSIVGAVLVSAESGQILLVGCVPPHYRPVGSIYPQNEAELLWAIKGAGTSIGIVISVTFKAHMASTFVARNWAVALKDHDEARLRLNDFHQLATRKLDRNCSADAYLYCEDGQLRLGVTMFERYVPRAASAAPTPARLDATWGTMTESQPMDGVDLFNAEMYVSGMHGGHAGGKTSSFKRCLFLKGIGEVGVADRLVKAVEARPSTLCYLHLLHGGGAIGDIASDATAFGCRDWDFACVITGVWPRHLDDTEIARSATTWVYNVAGELLSLSNGAYGADLGPDPRDTVLAAQAFGPNRPRLARLKRTMDPQNVFAYACPLPNTPMEPKLIVLVTGDSCAGKDYCAGVWVSNFNNCISNGVSARAVSISDATKREYAASTGADLNRLLSSRDYKEQHRSALTIFFKEQVQQRPRLPEDHFLSLVYGATDVEVLIITGMRDKLPVAAFSHLVPDSRLLEVHVQADARTRRIRRGCDGDTDKKDWRPSSEDLEHCPSFVFENDTPGNERASRFAEQKLLSFFHEDLARLASMIRTVPNFPREGVEFRHVLGISQHREGIALCTSLLRKQFAGNWAKIDAVVCCEVGGLVFASALASLVGVSLVLIREAGKLPPPTVSVVKPRSHISSSASTNKTETRIEMERDVVSRVASVVVVDDVLATGETLCAVLELLKKVGIATENVSVIVVAEFPFHRGRELLCQRGFGSVNVQSLLIFGGV